MSIGDGEMGKKATKIYIIFEDDVFRGWASSLTDAITYLSPRGLGVWQKRKTSAGTKWSCDNWTIMLTRAVNQGKTNTPLAEHPEGSITPTSTPGGVW